MKYYENMAWNDEFDDLYKRNKLIIKVIWSNS